MDTLTELKAERALIVEQAKAMAPFALKQLSMIPDGLYLSANDGDAAGLAAAHANSTIRRKYWCKSQRHIDNPGVYQVYYNDLNTNSHGWMCSACHGITQVG